MPSRVTTSNRPALLLALRRVDHRLLRRTADIGDGFPAAGDEDAGPIDDTRPPFLTQARLGEHTLKLLRQDAGGQHGLHLPLDHDRDRKIEQARPSVRHDLKVGHEELFSREDVRHAGALARDKGRLALGRPDELGMARVVEDGKRLDAVVARHVGDELDDAGIGPAKARREREAVEEARQGADLAVDDVGHVARDIEPFGRDRLPRRGGVMPGKDSGQNKHRHQGGGDQQQQIGANRVETVDRSRRARAQIGF